ncbi:FAD-binding oxidoreductase [Leucobacter iarius]|uniref:FAD-linked oxidase C-terminal domain-containing protein n=1 Tax=Leucobacter iarius TaxID=333963 RepID=A0ABP4XPE0_9MICO
MSGTNAGSSLDAELSGLLGAHWITDGSRLEALRGDRSGLIAEGRGIGLAEPADTEQAAAVLRIAAAHGVPVVPRGAGTGLAGGGVVGAGRIALSTARMTEIREIDPVDQVAVVGAGVINAELDRAARQYGLRYAPDPASRAISTIGGNIATNAGGLLCAKYGVTREAVLGLTAVLADGRILRTGHRSVKGVTGYDLTALLVGSEGTLGVITEATVRLIPRPDVEPVTVGAVLPDLGGALELCRELQAAGQRPALLEIMDARSLAAVTRYLPEADRPGPFAGPLGAGSAAVIVQWDAEGAGAAAERAMRLVDALGGRAIRCDDEAGGERVLGVRRAMNPALPNGTDVLIEDVCVPRSRLAEMYAAIARIEAETGIEIPTAGHAADGNLHPHLSVRAEDRTPGGEIPERVWDAAARVFRAALDLGGTLTGEHGIGVLKARWLRDELGDESFALQRGIRQLFDPRGQLNPDAVFVADDPGANANGDTVP